MRVLVADNFEASGIDGLLQAGCEVFHEPSLKDDALVEGIARTQADVLIVRSTKVNATALNAGPLKLVVRAGAGYNTIDVVAASAKGIYVSNCPGKNSVAVAELAFGHIASLDRRLVDNAVALRDGKWKKGEFSKARGLYGRTLGLIGLGKIGLEMIPRAKAFGMPVVAWSRSLTPERAEALGIVLASSPVEVARAADAISVHVAMNADTRGLCDADFFAAMREGAYFVNTSRGEVVDQAALVKAVTEKGVRAGLDVFATEPSGSAGDFADDIVNVPGVYGSAHIGASTDQAQLAIADEAVRIVTEFKDRGVVPNVVNLAKKTPATCSLVIRHLDQPGVLAACFGAIRSAGLNVQEMENIVFDGALAAVARINLDSAPGDEVLTAIKQNTAVVDVSVIAL